MSINISRTPVTQPTSDKFIYTTLFLYADSQERLTDTTSLQEINLSEFPEAARDWIESFYGVVDGLKRLVTKSVQGKKYTGHKEFDYCHYVCIDTVNINICSQLSDHLEGSRNLFVTLSGLENQNKNTYVLIVQQPQTPKHYLSKLYPIVLEPEEATSSASTDSGVPRDPPLNIYSSLSSATIVSGVLWSPQTTKYYLSKLYPIILEPEASTSSATIVSGVLRDPPLNIDSSLSSATIVSGVLRLSLFSISAPIETISSSSVIESGLLRVALKENNMQPEGLNTNLTILSGLLAAVLVTNTMQPEEITSLSTITGGSLT